MPAVKFSRELPEQPEREFDLLDTLKSLVDPRPAVSDAYWSATHPIDRIMGRGRAAGGGMMEFPWGAKFPPKSFPVGPPEKGLTAVRLPVSKNVKRNAKTEDTLTWRGTLMDTKYNYHERGMPRETWERHHLEQRALGGTERGRYGSVDAEGNPRGQATGRPKPRTVRELQREEKGSPVSYNIIDKEGKLVGSSHMRFFPDKTEVDEVFLKKELRGDVSIFKDIVGPAIDRGVPIDAVAGNPKIGKLLRRLAASGKKAGKSPIATTWGTAQQRADEILSMSPAQRRIDAVERLIDEQNPRNIPDRSMDLDAAERALDRPIRDRDDVTNLTSAEQRTAREIVLGAPHERIPLHPELSQTSLARRRLDQIRAATESRPALDRRAAENAELAQIARTLPPRRTPAQTAAEAGIARMLAVRQEREMQARAFNKTSEQRLASQQFQQRQRAAEAARQQRLAVARATMLAEQRRARNPMRVSRPGRGGV